MATGARRPLRIILFAQGFWASSVYRVSHRVYYSHIPVPLVRAMVRFMCQVARKVMEILTGISLPPDCYVGEGLYIGHFGNVIISPSARIGANCNLSQGVTLGYGGRGEWGGHPTVGNRVYIAANAVVVGNITVGDDAVIGAGAVVTKSVSPRAVIVGNPAQVTSYKGSFDFIRYDGMELDPERMASLACLEPADREPSGAPPAAQTAR